MSEVSPGDSIPASAAVAPPVPTIPLHRLRVYNPSRMTDQEITLLFVVREEILQRLLGDLSGEVPDSRPQHHLLVGQRGMGKTTLLLRIAGALRTAPLRDRFIPLSFAEEQYTIDRLSQFWLNCLDSLADSCDREGRDDQAQKIDRLVSGIATSLPSSPKDDTVAARAALKTLLDAAALTGRRPVLLIDNLQLIFERTAEQHRDLRAALTEPNAPILIAASPQLPPEISDYSFPLYDHFKIHQLRALSLVDMRQLLLQLADRTDKPAIRRHVLDHPGRLQALHQVTGGNPRTTVLLFHLYAEDCSPSIAEDLEKLLDDVTSLYKARFEDLSDQQQVIVSRLAEYWDPADSRTLTENTRLEPGQISSQLDRLVKAGVVEEVPLFGTKRTGYQLAERFFNIWFLMRHASRRLKQPVRFLTKFLETLYEPSERERFARSWSNSSGLNSSSLMFSRALADSLGESPVRGDLVRNTELQALLQQHADASRRVEQLFELDKIHPVVLEFADLSRQLTANYDPELANRILGSLDLFLSGRRALLAAVQAPSAEQAAAVLEFVSAEEHRLTAQFGHKAVAWLADRLLCGQLCQPDSIDDWAQTLGAASDHATVQLTVDSLPKNLAERLNPKILQRAASILTTAIPRTPRDWYNLASRLTAKLCQHNAAQAAIIQGLDAYPRSPLLWNGLGNLLQQHDCDDAAAEQAYRRAIELDPEFARASLECETTLHGDPNLIEETESDYINAKTPAWVHAAPWYNLGNLLQANSDRFSEAEQAQRTAIRLDPRSPLPWISLGNLYQNKLGRYADAADAWSNAGTFPQTRTEALLNLVVVQRDFPGDFSAARRTFSAIEDEPSPGFAATRSLHRALFAAYELNLGTAAGHLDAALDLVPDGLPPSTIDDWAGTAAVLLELGHGEWLQQVLIRRGHNHSLRPFFEAIRAHTLAARAALRNIAAEVRPAAGWLFDQIQQRRERLQEARRQRTEETPEPQPSRRRRKK